MAKKKYILSTKNYNDQTIKQQQPKDLDNNKKAKPSNQPNVQVAQNQTIRYQAKKNEQKEQKSIRQSGKGDDDMYSSEDFEAENYVRKLQFTIKQWILLGISKIIPHKGNNLNIDIKEGKVFGDKQKVDKFCEMCTEQLKVMMMKILKLKCEIPIQEIQIQMDSQWKCKVYTALTFRKVAEKIQQVYKVKNQVQNQIQITLNKDGINNFTRFLWVKSEFYNQASEILKQIHKKHNDEQQKIYQGSKLNHVESKLNQTSVLKDLSLSNDSSKVIQMKSSQIQVKQKPQNNRPQNSSQQESEQYDYHSIKQRHKNKGLQNKPKSKQQQKQAHLLLKLLEQNNDISVIEPANSSRIQRGNRRDTRKTLFASQFPERYLDRKHLENWVKHNKNLDHRDLKITQKYSTEKNQMLFQVVIYGQDPKGNKKYSIDMYFHYQRLIVLEEDESLRNKIIERFVSEESWMKVQYMKIYTQQKYPKQYRLRELAKKKNTGQKQKFNNLHHVLFLNGTMTQVTQTQEQIKQFIKQVQQTCRVIDFQLSFQQLSQFIRNDDVFEFIKSCMKQYLDGFSSRYKVIEITKVYNQFSIQLELFNVADMEVQRTVNDLKEKLINLIDHFDFEQTNYRHLKSVFQVLSQKYLMLQNSQKGITLISKTKQLKQQIKQINAQIQKSNQNVVRQLQVKHKSQFIHSRQFVEKKRKQQQFQRVQVRFQEKQNSNKIIFYGPQIFVTSLLSKVEQQLQNLTGKICQFHIQLNEEQLYCIQKNKLIQKHVQNDWNISLKYRKDYQIGAIFRIQSKVKNIQDYPVKQICFQRQFNFQSMEENSIFIFRSNKQIQSIKRAFIFPLKNQMKYQMNKYQSPYYEDKAKKILYIFQNQASPVQMFSHKNKLKRDTEHIYFYLPQKNENIKIIVQDLIKCLTSAQQQAYRLNITIIGKQGNDFQKILGYQQGKTKTKKKTDQKWYTLDGKNKLYYTQLGNRKIQQAYSKNLDSVLLTNEDLNLTQATHLFEYEKKTLKHAQSGTVFPFKQFSDRITFQLDGVQRTIPDLEFRKLQKTGTFPTRYADCNLSIGLYNLVFSQKVQVNLFSKYSRKLDYQQTELKIQCNYDLQVTYNVKTCQLSLEYSQDNFKFVPKAAQFILEQLQKFVVRVEREFDKFFTRQLLNQFLDEAKQQNISITQSGNGKSVTFEAYSQKKIQSFLKILQHSAKAFKSSRNQVQYPKQWSAQTKQIQTFIVHPNTLQFKSIEASFTSVKIVELVRLQNKYVYKRFYEQKMFLKQLNGGKTVKQMLLYHGTRNTDPKIIYEDKQECFNINYTRQTNLLGKGIYFAQKPQYSLGYSFCQNPTTRIFAMFYCCVLVGQSQKCQAHNGQIKDTNFRDPVNKIRYQSMTDYLQGSNVYVVYKNKRAYPLYLIKFVR